MKTIDTAVIPAAGLGTRGLPATKSIPKEMMPVFNTPSIHLIVEELAGAGVKKAVFVVNSDKKLVIDYFDRKPLLEHYLEVRGKTKELEEIKDICSLVDIITVRQPEPLGLGHAIYCAKPAVGDNPFAVLLPDEILFADTPGIKQLLDVRTDDSEMVLGLMEVDDGKQGLYGIADVDGSDYETSKPVDIVGVVEKPDPWRAPSRLALTGRYILPPKIFDAIEALEPSVGQEVQLTDAIFSLMKSGSRAVGVPLDGLRFDLGNNIDYLSACVYFAIKKSTMSFEIKLRILNLLSG